MSERNVIRDRKAGTEIINPQWAARPGQMEICGACAYAQDGECLSPDLKANGGAGITIIEVRNTSFFCAGKQSVMTIHYGAPPRRCSGSRILALVAP